MPPPDRLPPPRYAPGLQVGPQFAGRVSNSQWNHQWNQHFHTLVQQRESLARQIAATRTWAIRLIVAGLLTAAAGFGTLAFLSYRAAQQFTAFADEIEDFNNSFPRSLEEVEDTTDFGPPTSNFGEIAQNVPLMMVAEFAMYGGLLFALFGLVLHIVVVARRSALSNVDLQISQERSRYYER
ncbi:hypothetical protein ACWEKT_40705 [Nocardia takedensis]|uniref:hypothetical protein n=1 Tax=Nocardia takedensis TaxID=259390 RepID=UPI0012F62994|nr:hypothetical protein [Nocardia takedensis]